MHRSLAAIAPAQPTTPIVALGLVPRAHSAAAPSLSRAVRRLFRAWIAGTSPAMTVWVGGMAAVRDDGLRQRCVRTPACCSGGAQSSEEHTSELQSLNRNSYAVFCLQQQTH